MMGTRTPSLCIMPSILCRLYVSVDSLETRVGRVQESICRAERESVLENRSPRTLRVASRATREARRLAMMLPYSATSASASIPPPNRRREGTSLTGAFSPSSSIYPKRRGRRSSAMVPITLIMNPNAMRTAFGFKYCVIFTRSTAAPSFFFIKVFSIIKHFTGFVKRAFIRAGRPPRLCGGRPALMFPFAAQSDNLSLYTECPQSPSR